MKPLQYRIPQHMAGKPVKLALKQEVYADGYYALCPVKVRSV